jgi:broad specificity phosphatase PhoE
MSRIFLLRHAHSTANAKGILAGRLENIPLSKEGYSQREKLDLRISQTKFDQVISSPMQRCLETIANFESAPSIFDEFQEVHYGDWTGKKMSSLMRNAAWREIHKHPASVRFPNGETLPEVQTRSLLGLDLHVNSKSKNVLISTHADVVKVLILHALGTHLNNIDKVQIDNASISIIERGKQGFRVLRVNDNTSNIKELLA